MVSILNGNSSEHYTGIIGCEATESNTRPKQTTALPQGAAVQKNTEPKCLLVHSAKAHVVAKTKSEALTSQVVLYLSLHASHVFKCRC